MGGSLLDDARAEITHPGPQMCDVRKAVASNPKLQIDEAIRDRTLPATAVERALDKRQVILSSGTINRHRQNKCMSCRKAGVKW